MFIRRTHHKKKRTSGHYYTYRLVESQRIGAKVQQRTILNLGADFSLPKELWPILSKRIEEILCGQRSLLTIDCNIEKMAHNCAARILSKNHEDQQEDPDYRMVNLDSLNTYRPRSIGCEHVVLEALRTLELDAKFTSLGFNGPEVALAIGTVVGRACHPASERETHRWLQDQSGLFDAMVLLGIPNVNQTQEPVHLVGYTIDGKSYWVATDRFDILAEQVALIYKLRWDIESFFAWWKRHLKVYHLFARSKNGLMVQILSGLITYLLLAIYCHEQHGESVSIRRVRQLRNQIRNEITQQALEQSAVQDRKRRKHLKRLKKSRAIF